MPLTQCVSLLPIWSTICGHLPPPLWSPIPSNQRTAQSLLFVPLPCLDLGNPSVAQARWEEGPQVPDCGRIRLQASLPWQMCQRKL